jgi:hypothetical protein
VESVHSSEPHGDREPGERTGGSRLGNGGHLRTKRSRRSTNLLVQTFDASGNNVPENVNVIVVCP